VSGHCGFLGFVVGSEHPRGVQQALESPIALRKLATAASGSRATSSANLPSESTALSGADAKRQIPRAPADETGGERHQAEQGPPSVGPLNDEEQAQYD